MTGRPARGAEDEKGKRGPSEWAQRASERAPRSRTSPTLRPRSAGGGQPAERAECGEPVDGRTRWTLSSPGAPRARRASRARGGGRGERERGRGRGRDAADRRGRRGRVVHGNRDRLRVRLCVVLAQSPSFVSSSNSSLVFTMAEHLANIFGTEKDRVNCPFYFKIGSWFAPRVVLSSSSSSSSQLHRCRPSRPSRLRLPRQRQDRVDTAIAAPVFITSRQSRRPFC